MTIYIQQLMKEIVDVCDRFHSLVYGDGDVDAAAALLDPGAELRHLPTGSGAEGRDGVRRFLAQDLVPNRPADLQFRRLAQTGDRWRVADESVVGFTHESELPWLLPGVPPTHRHAEVTVMSMVRVSKSRIVSHRTLWDLHGLCAQLGVADATSPMVGRPAR